VREAFRIGTARLETVQLVVAEAASFGGQAGSLLHDNHDAKPPVSARSSSRDRGQTQMKLLVDPRDLSCRTVMIAVRHRQLALAEEFMYLDRAADRARLGALTGTPVVPALVVDGEVALGPVAIIEALDQHGQEPRLMPEPTSERCAVLSWHWLAERELLAPVERILGRDPNHRDNAVDRRRIGSFVALLDRQLADRPYLGGERPLLADVTASSVLMAAADADLIWDFRRRPRVADWYRSLANRLAWAGAYREAQDASDR
jgi:glutathione S-transferase